MSLDKKLSTAPAPERSSKSPECIAAGSSYHGSSHSFKETSKWAVTAHLEVNSPAHEKAATPREALVNEYESLVKKLEELPARYSGLRKKMETRQEVIEMELAKR